MSNSYKRFIQRVGEEGILTAARFGKAVKVIDIRVNGAVKKPLTILFNENHLQVEDTHIIFESHEAEVLFLQDLYFVLEEYSEIPTKSRITNGQKEVTIDQLLAEARKDIQKTSQGDIDGEK